jgi:hypothetical protein
VAFVEYVVSLVIGIDLIEVTESAASDADGELMRHLDDTMTSLGQRWIDNCSVDLDLVRSEVTFFIVVDTDDESRAVTQARGLLSIAIHSAGGATPHRPFPRNAAWSVRLLSVEAAAAPKRALASPRL